MFGKGNQLALRYGLYRTHLLERHVNALYSVLIKRLPEEADCLDALLGEWQREVGKMHKAFLEGDAKYFDQYERQFP
jgi:hypothetical protein